jgi:hypothetical protein
MQFRIFGRVFTVITHKSGPDYKFIFKSTKLEPPVIGVNSHLDSNDIYNGQKHVGILDFDDKLDLVMLKDFILQIQDKFNWVGNGYVYETSPKKYSVHFYQPKSYWEWMKIIHFSKDKMDPQYCKWRMMRPAMVMRFTPKMTGYIPKLVGIIKSKNKVSENTEFKDMVLSVLENEIHSKQDFDLDKKFKNIDYGALNW